LKPLSVLPHAVRTGTSAFPALTDLVQLLNEFWAKPVVSGQLFLIGVVAEFQFMPLNC